MGAIPAIRALKTALESRAPKPGMIHHSDRRIQPASLDTIQILEAKGIQGSMSRVGNS